MNFTKRLPRMILLGICVVLGCAVWQVFSYRRTQPVPLIDNLRSRMSFAQVKGLLQLDATNWRATERNHIEAGTDVRPVYDILSGEVLNYTHLNVRGKLFIYFYNDRLSFTTFFPQDYGVYKLRLIGQRQGVGVASDILFEDEHHCVTWSDENLRGEEDGYISDYA